MITLLPILAKEQSRIIINTVLVLMNPKHWMVAKGRHLFSHGGVCCKQWLSLMDFLYPESWNNKDSTHSVVYLLRDGNHNYHPAGEDRVQCSSCVVPRTDCGFPIFLIITNHVMCHPHTIGTLLLMPFFILSVMSYDIINPLITIFGFKWICGWHKNHAVKLIARH